MQRRAFLTMVMGGLLATTAAACGDGTGGGTPSASGSGSGSGSGTESTTTAGEAGAFPVTIEHEFGESTIEAAPERVVSIGFGDQDAILALGVVPVGIRDWYGDQPFAVWPWAQDELGDAEPEVLPADALDFEQIAALDPDLIVGISSGMTEEDYETLSAIAPTLAQSDEFIAYGEPWQSQTLTIGRALGQPAEAQALIDRTEARFAEIREEHPEFEGATAVVAYDYGNGTVGGYGPQDVRGRLMEALGFAPNPNIAERAGDSFYVDVSTEEIGLLDSDVIVWVTDDPSSLAALRANPIRQTLTAAQEGREVFLDTLEEGGAASFSSVLSLPFLLETFVDELAAALDERS